MMTLEGTEDFSSLREGLDLECKLAGGRDGSGQLPDDFWPTYSAFANTRGGVIVLGVRELGDRFDIAGLTRPERVRSTLFDLLNNPQKVSVNLVSDDDVVIREVEGKQIVTVRVAAAPRRSRPVYVNNNPMTGTYRRLHEGDRRCDRDTVQRMMAEQADSRDETIMRGYRVEDLDQDSLSAYRTALRTVHPGHVFLEQDGVPFLRAIGAWRHDRETDEEGVTLAGLLMFGRYEPIQSAFPMYLPDYQEQGDDPGNTRWSDRITFDGTWSGNLFDFYRRVYRKLISDLKVPFTLKDGQRMDETPVHEALREALVNVLVHADYAGPSSPRVVKRPNSFIFRNPGLMRVPPELARKGGEGDARNRRLAHLFFLVGAAERAGSGVPKIYRNWEDRHWLPPAYEQVVEPSDQTHLELSMLDFIPPEQVDRLRQIFGERFDDLGRDQRLILATACVEDTITHARMRPACGIHPADLTRVLQGLVQEGFLVRTGRTSATTYQLPASTLHLGVGGTGELAAPECGEQVKKRGEFMPQRGDLASQRGEPSIVRGEFEARGRGEESIEVPGSGGRGQPEGDPARASGWQLEAQPELPFVPASGSPSELPRIDALEDVSQELLSELTAIADQGAAKGRWSQIQATEIVSGICRGRGVTLRVLAQLVRRNEGHLRDRVLNPLVEAGVLLRTHPDVVNHPRQAYTTSEDWLARMGRV